MNNFTENEFKAYFLMYAAKADFVISPAEKSLILKVIDEDQYTKIETLLEKENDAETIQTILNFFKEQSISKESLSEWVIDLKELFFADGEYDTLERNLFISLNRLMNL